MIRRLFSFVPYLLTALVVLLVAAFALPPTPRGLAAGGVAPTSTVADDSLRVTGWAAIVAAPDSVVKLGTVVNNLRGMMAGDTLHFSYWATPAPGAAGPDTVLKHTRKLATRDSITSPAPAYAKTRHYKGCVNVEMGGRTSGRRWPAAAPMCWTWSYTRENRPDPGFDGIERIVLRPMPPALSRDNLSACQGWQAAHPGASVWRSASEVNRRAVPECSTDTQLIVWQFCAFAEDTLGRPLITAPSASVPYCAEEYQRWLSERDV